MPDALRAYVACSAGADRRRTLTRIVRPDHRGASRGHSLCDDDGLRTPTREPYQFPARTPHRGSVGIPRRPVAAIRCVQRKTVRYPGFKEELYLAGFRPDPAVLHELGLDPGHVIAVLEASAGGSPRPPVGERTIREGLCLALDYEGVQVVMASSDSRAGQTVPRTVRPHPNP